MVHRYGFFLCLLFIRPVDAAGHCGTFFDIKLLSKVFPR